MDKENILPTILLSILFIVLLFLGIGYSIALPDDIPGYNDRDCNDELERADNNCYKVCKEGHILYHWGKHNYCYWDNDE